jgi:transmembrane sensor
MTQRQPLRDALSETELSETWQRVVASRDANLVRRARVRGGGVALAFATAVALFVIFWPRPSEQLLDVDGAPWKGVVAGQHLRLADESRIEVSPDGRLEVLENGAARLSLHLMRGRARFEVTPGTGRQWRVECGGVSIEVVGTVFDVTRAAQAVQVSVERGVVVVRGQGVPDGVRRLVAGEQLVVSRALAAAPQPEVVAIPAPKVLAVTPRATAPKTPAPAPAPPPVPPDEPQPAETPASVLADADVARREGRAEDAIEKLTSIVTRWPRAPEGPLAAFTLANLYTSRGNDEAGREWYRRALELELDEPLAGAARRALDAGR